MWKGAPDGTELFARVKALPGFGEQKAKIFVALLGKQLGVNPDGWRAASKPFGAEGTYLSVADITDAESMAKVRATKKALKAKAKARVGVSAGFDLSTRRLYLCTPDRPDLADFVAACIAGGVDVVQLRDKQLEARPLLERAAVVRAVCRTPASLSCSTTVPTWRWPSGRTGCTSARTTPRSRWPAASSVPTPSSVCPPTARPTWPVRRPRTSRTSRPARSRRRRPSPVAPGPGLDYVSRATARSTVPVFVTGGVTPERIPALVAAGVRHFVVVRALTEAPDATRAARALRDAIDRALSSAPQVHDVEWLRPRGLVGRGRPDHRGPGGSGQRRDRIGQRTSVGHGVLGGLHVEGHRFERGGERRRDEGRQRHGVGHPHPDRLDARSAGSPGRARSR